MSDNIIMKNTRDAPYQPPGDWRWMLGYQVEGDNEVSVLSTVFSQPMNP